MKERTIETPFVRYGIMNSKEEFISPTGTTKDPNEARCFNRRSTAESIIRTHYRSRMEQLSVVIFSTSTIQVDEISYDFVDKDLKLEEKKRQSMAEQNEGDAIVRQMMCDRNGVREVFIPDADSEAYDRKNYHIYQRGNCVTIPFSRVPNGPLAFFGKNKIYRVKKVASFSSQTTKNVPFVLLVNADCYVHPKFLVAYTTKRGRHLKNEGRNNRNNQ